MFLFCSGIDAPPAIFTLTDLCGMNKIIYYVFIRCQWNSKELSVMITKVDR